MQTTTAHPDREIERGGARGFARDVEHMIERHEGFRAKPYKDSRGIRTIGFGTNIDGAEMSAEERAAIEEGGGSLSQERARELMRADLKRVEGELDQTFTEWRDWPREARLAIVNMSYNMGRTRLAGFDRMIAALKRGDFGSAAKEVRDSKYARDRDTARRARELAKLFDAAARAGRQ